MGRKYDFILQYLKNQLALESQWWLVLLDFSCSFIWAQLILRRFSPLTGPFESDMSCDKTEYTRQVLKLYELLLENVGLFQQIFLDKIQSASKSLDTDIQNYYCGSSYIGNWQRF